MIKYRLMRLRRSVERALRRLPRVPRTVARNVLMLWFFVMVAVGAGAAWKMYVQDDVALLQFARDEWQAGVDKIGEIVPGAVAFVAEQKTWVTAILNSALPRRPATSTESGESAGPQWGVDDEGVSAWRRAADLLMWIALGYDVTDGQELLAAAVPDASNPGGIDNTHSAAAHSRTTTSGPAGSGATPSSSDVGGARVAQPSSIHDGSPERVVEHLQGGGQEAIGVAARLHPPATSGGTGAVNASATPRIPAPGPPRPEPPNGFRDEVQATFGVSTDRVEGSLRDFSSSLRDQSCRVLIFHTHTSETYRSDTFAPGQADQYHLWNSTDSGIVQVGGAMKRALEEKFGIPTCHVTTIHDWPSHARAYVESRTTVEAFLRQNPQVELVLDVHRDAPSDLVTTVAGRTAAQVAIVVGTHPTMHPASATNVAIAGHIGRLIEQRYPGLFRRVIERPDARFNQDLHPRAIILEIGSYDTHLDAALETGDLLAAVLAETVGSIRSRSLPGVGAPR